jgi:hypothetical protein
LVTEGDHLRGHPARWSSGALGLSVAIALASIACDDAPPEPRPIPGDVVVTLVSPNGAEGAAVLSTAGTGIVDVTAQESVRVFHWRAGGVSRIVVLRDEVGVIWFTMSVENVARPPQMEVVEVADGDNRLRSSLMGYAVEVEPAGGAGS